MSGSDSAIRSAIGLDFPGKVKIIFPHTGSVSVIEKTRKRNCFHWSQSTDNSGITVEERTWRADGGGKEGDEVK